MGMNLRYSPLEWNDKTKSFDFGGGTIDNATITSLLSTTGNVYYVSSKAVDNPLDAEGSQGLSKDAPLRTLEYAIGRCTANNGDVIALMPGYTDTVASAGDKAIAKAGITVVGLGHGADRANLTWSATASSFDITGASTRIFNIIGTAGIDSIVEAFNVQAADCEFDIEWRDGSATVEAITIFLCNASADNLKINLTYQGFAAGNACDSPISLNGSIGAEINVNFYGKAATAIVEFITAAVTDANVTGYFYCSGTTDLSKNVVDTVTGSTWSVQGFDGAAGVEFSGGSGKAVEAAGTDIDAILVDTGTTLPATLAAMPQCVAKTDGAVLTGNDNLFTISGGPVRAKIVGIVTTIVGGASNGDLQIVTTTPSATVDLNAAPVAIDNDAAGTSYHNVGATSVFTPTTAGVVLIDPVTVEETEFILPIGTVHFRSSAAQTGVIAWYMTYTPLSPLSVVTAAA